MNKNIFHCDDQDSCKDLMMFIILSVFLLFIIFGMVAVMFGVGP